MKILVTGADGFIGRHLVPHLRAAGHDVIHVDRGSGDLRIQAEVDQVVGYASSWGATVCVHLAAKVGRQFGEDDPAETVLDNAGMTALVAKACGRHGIRLVYASTSEVYGDQGDENCIELLSDRRGRVHNIYGLSKRWGEEVGQLYAPDGFTALRLSMPYGPGLPWGRGRAAIINMLWQAENRQEIPVHHPAERSWCWVGDTIRGIRYTIEKAEEGFFNVGRDDASVSMLDVARLACELTGADPDSLIRLVPAPTNQTLVKRLSTARLRSLGWRPEVGLADGMLATLDWIRVRAASDGDWVQPDAPVPDGGGAVVQIGPDSWMVRGSGS